jgi:hypothetical protein
MTTGEQRAFLIDVRAPQQLGTYIVVARVSSSTADSDYGDNEELGATEIVAP